MGYIPTPEIYIDPIDTVLGRNRLIRSNACECADETARVNQMLGVQIARKEITPRIVSSGIDARQIFADVRKYRTLL